MLLQLSDVSKTYREGTREVPALRNVHLEVDAGQFVAVRGPSGCGKTTLLLIAGGLLKPDSGQVTVAGKNPYSLTPDERAQFRADHIGFVFQQFHLVPYLSVLDNILAPAMAASATDASSSSPARDRAEKLMEQFGLADRSHHVPGKLSSGERQRVAMARALLNQPRIILADEPTGNLDHGNADKLLEFLHDFADQGGGVLLVTHDDRAVEGVADVIQLDNGTIVTASV